MFELQAPGALEFRGRAAACADVGSLRVVRYAVGVVGVATAAHRHVQALAVAEAVDQDVGGVDGAALGGVPNGGLRVRRRDLDAWLATQEVA